MKSRTCLFKAALLGTALATPTMALAGPALPTCAQLGTSLAANPALTGVTAVIVPVNLPTVTVPYCQLNFTDVSLAGPKFGYRTGQTSLYGIQIGLPLSLADGGSGNVQGDWNGKVRTLGNGGFAGAIVAITAGTNEGYITTTSNSGHNGAIVVTAPWPNGPLPTTNVFPDQSSAAFAINADGSLNLGELDDYAYRSEHHANMWARKLSPIYYGMKNTRNYYTGCSDGGREGHELASRFGDKFDGLVAMSPAVGHPLQQFAAGYANYMTQNEMGKPGFNTVKFTDLNARVLAFCDPLDGITDGMILEHRACTYDANMAVCGQPGASTDPTKCLTTVEASIANRIWSGPLNPDGSKFWYGWDKGQAALLGVTGDVTTSVVSGWPDFFGEELYRYWVLKNPFFDWRTTTEAEFLKQIDQTVKAITPYVGADNPDMTLLRNSGHKMIVPTGNADQVIMPDGIINFVHRVADHAGGFPQMQENYRFFEYSGATHCGGAGLDIERIFTALVDWVEHGNKPDYLEAQVNPTRTRKVCMYPNIAVYSGQGSTDDQNSFFCQTRDHDPFYVGATEQTLPPHEGEHDINELPDSPN
jgi:hypothetical protein